MPAIKPDRLLGDLYKLRTFGTYKTGVHRPTFSADDIAARAVVRRAMHRGRARDHHRRHRQHFRQAPGDAARKALSGSHLESQNQAGWLDGALGCVYALEACARDQGGGRRYRRRRRGVRDEEGHFGSFLGSKSFTGLLTEADIDKAKNKNDGTPMREALASRRLCGPAARS